MTEAEGSEDSAEASEHGNDAVAPELDPEPAPLRDPVDRQVVVHQWAKAAGGAALRVILIGVTVAALLWLLGRIWVGVLPILLAVIVTTVLWPAVAWMRAHRVPASLAALIGILVPFVVLGGVFAAIAPSVISQAADLIDQAAAGLVHLRDWAYGPPINLQNEQIAQATNAAVERLQGSSSQIASGVFTGVGAVASALVSAVLILVLTFFFLKDGPRFLPWVRSVVGRRAGRHLTEAATRSWRTLSGFIRTQAIVSAVDAVFIGIGLAVLQVPLAFALALLTFLGGFIPIVGAFAVGAIAVLVALVGNGWGTALAVLALIIVVQQVESNLLQPYLQGKSMDLHAGIILLAVAVGGTLFGIIGAFLAVPVAAVVATILRYTGEQIDLRTGELRPEDVQPLTPEGVEANRHAAAQVEAFRALDRGEDTSPIQ
jgi:putative heme transporter